MFKGNVSFVARVPMLHSIKPHSVRIHQRNGCCMTSNVQLQPELLAARRRVTEVLRKDLMRQYDEPNNLDWSIFDNQVSFDDPMTKLRGKLMYRV